jgi:hypothetical protein
LLFLGLCYFGYGYLPEDLKVLVDSGLEKVWLASRWLAKELGLFQLISYGIDGIKGILQWANSFDPP